MDQNSNISPKWADFHKLWINVAIALFVLLLILMALGYGPGGTKSKVPPTIVEKIVEKEKLVDNPALLSRIGTLEKENTQIALLKTENTQIPELKSNIADLTKTTGLVAGLQAKVKALEAVDLNFENPILLKRINFLETENSQIPELKSSVTDLTKAKGLIAGLQAKVKALEAIDLNFENPILLKRINLLETDNAQISGLKSNITDLTKTTDLVAGLQAKVKALEAVDINFIKPEDNTQLLQKISGLEAKNLAIPVLESRIEVLEAKEPTLVSKISELEKENGLIAGLKAKVTALEAIDINFIKPQDNTGLLQKIKNLEVKNLTIPVLESRIKDLESQEPKVLMKEIDNPMLVKRIEELETQNGLIPGLQAKIKALEAIDINFN